MIIPMLLGMTLTSPDVKTGVQIPHKFVWNQNGCDGDNREPRLQWSGVPAGTHSFDLSVIDHDAPKPGGWVHLHVTGLRGTSRGIGHRAQPGFDMVNDFHDKGWGGPCPPPGQLHHYTFTLRALDARGRALAAATMIPMYKR